MLSDFTGADKVYLACGYTDLRLGIDGLAALVKQQFSLDPFENCLFFSAEGGGTGSRRCTGRETAFFSSTSVWNRVPSSGREKKVRPKPLPRSNTAGSWRDSALTSQRPISR